MEVILKSTNKIVELNGIPARIWEGETFSGIKLHCYITRVGISKDEPRFKEFDKELKQQAIPSTEVEAIPLKMIL